MYSHSSGSSAKISRTRLAPGSADNSTVLLIASGKNNNFKELPTFAIEWDAVTMSYNVKPDFDFEAWQEEIAGTSKRQKTAGEGEILALLRAAGGRLEKKVLIEQARARTRRGENHLRKVIEDMIEAKTVTA